MKLLRTEFQGRKVTSCVTSTVRHNGVTHSLPRPSHGSLHHTAHTGRRRASSPLSPFPSRQLHPPLPPSYTTLLHVYPAATTTHHSPHLYSPLNTMMSSPPCNLTTVVHLTLTTHPINTRQLHTKHLPPTPVATPPITVVDSCFTTSTVPSRPPTSFIMSLN